MQKLRYEAPGSLADATALLAGESGMTRILAGGTDVIVQMHSDLIEPDLIVDVKNIPELTEIKKEGGAYRFGAVVSGKTLMLHEDFNKTWPGVMDGVRLIGSLQVRGRASVGGNLCNASPEADIVPPLATAAESRRAGQAEVPPPTARWLESVERIESVWRAAAAAAEE